MSDETTMREAFVRETTTLLRDPRTALVLADISADRFAGAAARHPSRVINVGIREQLMVSVAGGLALAGIHPIIHSYAPFLVERAFEQVKLDLGHQDVAATLVSVGASHDDPAVGRTHQAPGDVALVDTLSGWTVEVPGHPDEVAPILYRARGGGRTYVRLSTATASCAPGTAAAADGRPVVMRRGRRGTVVAVGPTLDTVLAATEGLDVDVLYVVTVRPFDGAVLREVLSRPVVSLVEPYAAGTSAWAVGRALSDLPHRLACHGVVEPETHRYGGRADHERLQGLDAATLADHLAAHHR